MSTLPTTPKVPVKVPLSLSEWSQKNVDNLNKYRLKLGRLKSEGVIHSGLFEDGEKAIRLLKSLFQLGV